MATSAGPFDLFLDLPVHPLVVHAAVVLLPLSALSLLLLFAMKRLRAPLAWPTVLILLAGTLAALAAKASGEALADRTREPEQHEMWGNLVPFAALALLIVASAWLVLDRKLTQPSAIPAIAGTLTAVAAVAVLGLTVMAGHTGAYAAWAHAVTGTTPQGTGEATGTAAPEPSGPATSAPASTSAGTGTATQADPAATGTATPYTLAQVAQHATQADCWAAVNGKVYNLTEWIGNHPGGPQRIIGMCGKDATSEFTGEHDTDPGPVQRLASFQIGTLAAS